MCWERWFQSGGFGERWFWHLVLAGLHSSNLYVTVSRFSNIGTSISYLISRVSIEVAVTVYLENEYRSLSVAELPYLFILLLSLLCSIIFALYILFQPCLSCLLYLFYLILTSSQSLEPSLWMLFCRVVSGHHIRPLYSVIAIFR